MSTYRYLPRRSSELSAVRQSASVLLLVSMLAMGTGFLWSWDSKPHSQIVDAALTIVSERDRMPQRLGAETWRLRYYVQMADWRDSFIAVSDNWATRTDTFGTVYAQFYANDYLLFPAAPVQFDHAPPGVLGAYHPFFLRALQALRTESSANAARWMGSLLHFVTDSGSPPHALGIHGELHTKMESWLDASRIDLTGYKPQLLGATDEEAAQGLVKRMNGLIAFSKLQAERMLPFAQADDRPHVEPLALESATETAKVTADVIHTLMTLAAQPPPRSGASLVAEVSAPPVTGMDMVGAKLMLIGTNYSTLAELSAIPANAHRGSWYPSSSFIAESEKLVKESVAYKGRFFFRNLPPGSYRGILERVGARPLFVGPLVLRAGQTLHAAWQLQPADCPGNLVRNPDFAVCWILPNIPDHWRFDKPHVQWLSDNMPVDAGEHYRAGYYGNGATSASVKLQWMDASWKPLDTPLMELPSGTTPAKGIDVVAPLKAVYARIVVDGSESPAASLHFVFLIRGN